MKAVSYPFATRLINDITKIDHTNICRYDCRYIFRDRYQAIVRFKKTNKWFVDSISRHTISVYMQLMIPYIRSPKIGKYRNVRYALAGLLKSMLHHKVIQSKDIELIVFPSNFSTSEVIQYGRDYYGLDNLGNIYLTDLVKYLKNQPIRLDHDDIDTYHDQVIDELIAIKPKEVYLKDNQLDYKYTRLPDYIEQITDDHIRESFSKIHKYNKSFVDLVNMMVFNHHNPSSLVWNYINLLLIPDKKLNI